MVPNQHYVYRNLIAEMNRYGDTLKTASQAIGIGPQALSARLQGKKSFELPEICSLMKRYESTFNYLFSTNDLESGPPQDQAG